MTWFKQDSNFWRHRKLRRIPNAPITVSTRVAAAGVWSLSGVWSSDNLSDGFVPAEQLQEWDPTEHVAQRLVAAGLWEEADQDGERGYQFRNWEEYQPTRDQVEREREGARERMRRYRERSRDVTPNVPRNGTATTGVRDGTAGQRIPFAVTNAGRSPAVTGEVRQLRSDPIRSSSSSSTSSTHALIAQALGLDEEDDEEEIQTIYKLILRECKPNAPARYIQRLADNGDLTAYQTRARAAATSEATPYAGPTHDFVKSHHWPDDPSCAADGCLRGATNRVHRVPAGATA